MQVVYALTIVHYLESTHHEARKTRFLTVPQFVSRRIMLSFLLPMLNIDLPQSFKSPFQGLHIMLAVASGSCVRNGDRDVLRIDSGT